jgi:hypothetical protein
VLGWRGNLHGRWRRIVASGTLVPLLLQLGASAAWLGLGALSLVLMLIGWSGWPSVSPAAPARKLRSPCLPALHSLYVMYARICGLACFLRQGRVSSRAASQLRLRSGTQAALIRNAWGIRQRAIPLKHPTPSALGVLVTVMDVRVVRMPVSKRFMPVPVRMRLGHRRVVHMAMMFVVDVAMLVLDRLVCVVMGMTFGQMQPDAERHQQARKDQLRRDRLA